MSTASLSVQNQRKSNANCKPQKSKKQQKSLIPSPFPFSLSPPTQKARATTEVIASHRKKGVTSLILDALIEELTVPDFENTTPDLPSSSKSAGVDSDALGSGHGVLDDVGVLSSVFF